jgi:hypothetical protein
VSVLQVALPFVRPERLDSRGVPPPLEEVGPSFLLGEDRVGSISRMSRTDAPRLWARSTIRGHLRATIFIALFAGLASGAVLTAVEVARRTSSAYARYLDYAHVAALSVVVCPAGVTQDSLAEGFDVCFDDQNMRDTSVIVSRLPEVSGVGRVALSPVGVADPSLKSGWQGTLALSTIDPGILVRPATPGEWAAARARRRR